MVNHLTCLAPATGWTLSDAIALHMWIAQSDAKSPSQVNSRPNPHMIPWPLSLQHIVQDMYMDHIQGIVCNTASL